MLKEIFEDVIHNISFVLIEKNELQEGNINLSSNRSPDHDIAKYPLYVNQDRFLWEETSNSSMLHMFIKNWSWMKLIRIVQYFWK